jgi:hypothetical protein
MLNCRTSEGEKATQRGGRKERRKMRFRRSHFQVKYKCTRLISLTIDARSPCQKIFGGANRSDYSTYREASLDP